MPDTTSETLYVKIKPTPGADPVSQLRPRGAISIMFGNEVSLRVRYCKRDQVDFTKWPYIANAVFRIVQNHGEKVTFVGFKGASPPLDPPLTYTMTWYEERTDLKRAWRFLRTNKNFPFKSSCLGVQWTKFVCCVRTVARKSSIGGLYVRAGRAWHSNSTKIVFHISIWGTWALFGGY